MNIQLSEHFTYKKLLRFILPSIIMMVFTSIYSVVDGIFVSNFVGKSAFFDAGYDCCYRRVCVICSQFYIYEADCHGIWCRR